MNKNILITGAAGFIGFHLSEFFLKKKYTVYGIDIITSNYDISLKKKRLKFLNNYKNFKFHKIDICQKKNLFQISNINFHSIFHLAGQPGVLQSMKDPTLYYRRNIIGFQHILDIAIKKNSNFFYASSSSVYGNQNKNELYEDMIPNPNSIYGLTKEFNEKIVLILAKGIINAYGLRFFTVYGPLGRPDMAIFKFTKNLYNKKRIILRNNGEFYRDFTYIDDVIKAIYKIYVASKKNKKIKETKVFNIGFGRPIKINDLIKKLEKITGIKGKIEKEIGSSNEVLITNSSSKKLFRNIPKFQITTIEKGLNKFVNWYKEYSKDNSLRKKYIK